MTLSRREQMLLALLPAVLLLGLHFALLRPAAKRRLDEARHRIEAAGGDAGEPFADAAAGSQPPPQQGDGKARLARAGDLQLDLERRTAVLREKWVRSGERALAIRELSSLFQASGVHVERSCSQSEEGAPKQSRALRELQLGMRDLGAGTPELWRFDLRGPYDAILRAVDGELRASRFGLPLAFAATLARSARSERELEFTIWFWI